jgi:hypothetical protein
MENNIKHDIQRFAKEHHIHISASPYSFCGTILGWTVNVISFNDAVNSKINAAGRHEDEETALRAGIDYVTKLLRL